MNSTPEQTQNIIKALDSGESNVFNSNHNTMNTPQKAVTGARNAERVECEKEVERLRTDCESQRLTPYVDWQTWASCLPQSQIDRIGIKTGFRVGDSFNPDKSDDFNNAVNQARAKKLGLKP